LLPKPHRDLLILARCVYLAEHWKGQNPEYAKLQIRYQKELRENLKVRFDRFAILAKWDFQNPKSCRFFIESHKAEGHKIPEAIDKHVAENLFVPEEFQDYILATAPNNEPVGKIMKELKEPRPNGLDCIPWLGETLVKEHVIRLCARGLIAINLRGMEYLQIQDGESEDAAWIRMRGKLGTGKHLDETHILLPQNIPASGGVKQPTEPVGAAGPIIPPAGISGNVPSVNDPGLTPGENQPAGIFNPGPGFIPLTVPPTSALNLLGKIEIFGIKPGTQVKSLVLRIDKLTGAQLQDLIKKLPDGMTYELGLEKEKSE